jgi:hypothetical protein
MQNIISLNLSGKSHETIGSLSDSTCSIVFCETVNGLFFSDIEQNTISILRLDSNNIDPWVDGDVLHPKGVYVDKTHKRMFFDDDKYVFDGYWTNGSHISLLGKSTATWFKPIQEKRTSDANHLQRKKHFCYCDAFQNAIVAVSNKNRVYRVDRHGAHHPMLASGKQGFCVASTPQLIEMNNPTGVLYLPEKEIICVADTNNHIIRQFGINRTVTEMKIIGVPLSDGCKNDILCKSTFQYPSEICCINDVLYVVDGKGSNFIRKINLANDCVSTLYQSGNFITSITCSSDHMFILQKDSNAN